MKAWEVVAGDALEVLARLEPESVDAIVTDPPYGLEFMGREWDRFREDDPGTGRHRGENAGEHGAVGLDKGLHPAGRGAVVYGGGERPSTSRCTGCGKRDQFRKPHECPEGTGWRRELIDPHAAPPSMLAFQSWCREWARLALRALKPGGYLLAFGGTRTYHRMASGVEDAGFEVRDQLQWLYGSGFPKSLDVGKAIDARGGAPATSEADRWQGWGTALKPAHEPIVVARKPLAGTVAANVLAHGTGALNVDGCRIATTDSRARMNHARTDGTSYVVQREDKFIDPGGDGRWPANVVLDPEAAAMLDEQTGERQAGARPARRGAGTSGYHGWPTGTNDGERIEFEAGGASRFFATFGQEENPWTTGHANLTRFRYCPKSSSAERNAGLDGFEAKPAGAFEDDDYEWPDGRDTRKRNVHPTVKPIDLMRWLMRLVTPPGGLVLDPFTGSGTTGCAAVLEGFRFVGIERDAEYAEIARARIAWWAEHPAGMELVRRLELEAARAEVSAAGQLDLFAPVPDVGSAA